MKPLIRIVAGVTGVVAEGIAAYSIPPLAWVLAVGGLTLVSAAFVVVVIVLFTQNKTPFERLIRLTRPNARDQLAPTTDTTELPPGKDNPVEESRLPARGDAA